MLEIAFISPRNFTFDRYVFFSRKLKKGKTVEQFFTVLRKPRGGYNSGDAFITNMLNKDIQREILRDKIEP